MAWQQCVRDAFGARESALFTGLMERCSTSHWDPMLGDAAALERKLIRSQYVLDRIEGAGRRVLDYGSGMGFLACYMALSAEEVVGVEIVDSHRDASEYLAKRVFNVDNARFTRSDDSLKSASFDAAVMCNVISHVANLPDVTGRVRDLLKPGGLLFVEDNNNRRSIVVRRRQPEAWRRGDETPLRKRRALDPGREYETYGMTREQIESWRGKDLAPLQRLREFAPRDPQNEMYQENWFTPHELEIILFNSGFAPLEHRAKYIFDYKKNELVSRTFKMFPRLSLFVAPAFEVTAVRI